MTAAVTGASGQLGCAMASVWPEAERWYRYELDLADSAAVIRGKIIAAQPDVLVNGAAYTAVDQAEVEPDKAHHINAAAVEVLADACHEAGSRLIHISTDYVFSGKPPGAAGWKSDDRPHPVSIYGGTKLLGERAALNYTDNLVVRTSWVFGNGQNFVRTMRRLGRSHEVVEVVDDQIGRPTFANDLAAAIRFLASQPELGDRIWHVQNSGPEISWAEFAEAIFDFDGVNCAVKRISTDEYAAKAKGQGKRLAARPECSVLDLRPLEEAGHVMRDWHEALGQYLRENPPPT